MAESESTATGAHPLDRACHRRVKRASDLVLTLVTGLLVLWWLHLLICLLIRLTSRGPAIFRQPRIGLDGCHFVCLKYRTMHWSELHSAEPTRERDPRITAIGRWLRSTNLDELPQFWNVLRGEMSIVGPRPHMLSEDAELQQYIPDYRRRLRVLPGITGYAAIRGYRGGTRDMTHMAKRVECDCWYIDNWSLPLDLRIMVTTAWRMLTGRAGGK